MPGRTEYERVHFAWRLSSTWCRARRPATRLGSRPSTHREANVSLARGLRLLDRVRCAARAGDPAERRHRTPDPEVRSRRAEVDRQGDAVEPGRRCGGVGELPCARPEERSRRIARPPRQRSSNRLPQRGQERQPEPVARPPQLGREVPPHPRVVRSPRGCRSLPGGGYLTASQVGTEGGRGAPTRARGDYRRGHGRTRASPLRRRPWARA
jgi:hypothetical protein